MRWLKQIRRQLIINVMLTVSSCAVIGIAWFLPGGDVAMVFVFESAKHRLENDRRDEAWRHLWVELSTAAQLHENGILKGVQ